MSRSLIHTLETSCPACTNAIGICDGGPINGEHATSRGTAPSTVTDEPMKFQTIEGDWLSFNPNAVWAEAHAFQNYLRIWRAPDGKYSAKLNRPGNFFTIEE